MAKEFQLTGKHVLGALLGFFLVVLVANVIFLNLAMSTFPGEKEEKSYLQGLNYNDRLAKRAEQAELGWRAAITEASRQGDEATIGILMTDRAGAPLSSLRLDAVIARPAADAHDAAIAFSPVGGGRYRAIVSAGAGLWTLEGVAIDRQGREFEFTSRLEIE